MNKKSPTKAEIRQKLQAEVANFLQKGGAITQVQMGESGLVDGRYSSLKPTFGKSQTTERTPVAGLLAVIDSRKKSKSRTVTATTPRRAPKKQVIYDDFGEPLRTVWVEK